AEEADERATAQGDSNSAATTTPTRKRDQSIRKYLQSRAQETPSRVQGGVMEVGEEETPSRPAREELHQDEQGDQCPVARPSTPPVSVDQNDPTTPVRRPPKRQRGEDNDDAEYLLPDFSPSEEEQAEQI